MVIDVTMSSSPFDGNIIILNAEAVVELGRNLLSKIMLLFLLHLLFIWEVVTG